LRCLYVTCCVVPSLSSDLIAPASVLLPLAGFLFHNLACTAANNTHSFCRHVSDLDNNNTINNCMSSYLDDGLLCLLVTDTAYCSYSYVDWSCASQTRHITALAILCSLCLNSAVTRRGRTIGGKKQSGRIEHFYSDRFTDDRTPDECPSDIP
jgi:hypothetical protein